MRSSEIIQIYRYIRVRLNFSYISMCNFMKTENWVICHCSVLKFGSNGRTVRAILGASPSGDNYNLSEQFHTGDCRQKGCGSVTLIRTLLRSFISVNIYTRICFKKFTIFFMILFKSCHYCTQVWAIFFKWKNMFSLFFITLNVRILGQIHNTDYRI